MLTIEEVQAAIGDLWRVDSVTPRSWSLSLGDEEDRDAFLIKLEKVRDIAFRHMDEVTCHQVDAIWYAAEVLLGPSKFVGLQNMFLDSPDELTDGTVALALLGSSATAEECITFVAEDMLLAGIVDLVDAMGPVLSEIVAKDGAQAGEWHASRELGWTEFLPTEFTIYKLGEWETDGHFLDRCYHTLRQLAKLFPTCGKESP